MSSSEQWRVFCAVDIPHNVRQKIEEHISHLKRSVPDASASWTRLDNMHLTLKFLGDTPKRAVQKLSHAAQRAVLGLAPFEIIATGAGSFPKSGQPRVVWVGLEDVEGKLAHLQARLEEEAFKEGFAREQRAFHPHLTVARLRKPHGARRLATAHKELGFPSITIEVKELLVIRSELHPSGSRYTVISHHRLQNREQ